MRGIIPHIGFAAAKEAPFYYLNAKTGELHHGTYYLKFFKDLWNETEAQRKPYFSLIPGEKEHLSEFYDENLE